MWGLMSVIWIEASGFMSLSLAFSWLAGLFLRMGSESDFSSCRRLQAEGIIFETEKLFRKEFWEHGMKFAFFRGPDGERLEIAEY